ncbi:hypothetical protein BJ741DRAFT_651930 [Chytriomyces cf. hyalinus JEL632]|nr:hypothetical protein BJ741DRAFT_651930 [Chytriomyces cf. hyalinus JEL632]
MFIPLASVLALASIPTITAQAIVQQVGGFCSADLSGYYQTVCAPGLHKHQNRSSVNYNSRSAESIPAANHQRFYNNRGSHDNIDGSNCQPATTTTANTTQPALPQGSSCNPSASGPNSVTCAAGLRCGPVPTNASMFTCQSFIPTPIQPIPQGGRCNVTTGSANPSFAQCGQGLTCLAVAGQAGSFTCQTPAPPVQPTAPPSTGGNGKQCGGFAGLPCPMGLICTFAPTPVPISDSFGVCAAPSYQVSGQGGPCSATNAANTPICASGLDPQNQHQLALKASTAFPVGTLLSLKPPARASPQAAQFQLSRAMSVNSVEATALSNLNALVTGQSGQIVLYQNGQILYGSRVVLQQSDIAQLAARVSIQATTCGRIIEEISRIQAATIDFRVATRLIAARFGVSSLTLVNIANGCAGQFSTVPNVFQVLSTISTYGSYFGQTVVKIPIAANVYGGVQITATYLGLSSQTVYFKRVIGCVGQWGFSRVDASTNATQEVVLNVINSIINGQDIRSSSTDDIKKEVEAISTANDVAPAFVVNVASNIHDSMVESNETTNTTALALFSAVAGADLNATLALDAQGEDSSFETASSALAAGISIVVSMIAFYAL